MGNHFHLINKRNTMIKTFLVACCAAFVSAEADAFHHTYAAPIHHAVGYAAHHVAPVHHAVSYAAPVHHAVHHVTPVHHAVGYASSNIANTVGIHGAAPAAIPAVAGAYAGAGRYVANSAGTVHVAKREAEAEPEALYSAYGYGLGYSGLGYGHHVGYSTLGYGHHLGYSSYGYPHGYSYGHGYGNYG